MACALGSGWTNRSWKLFFTSLLRYFLAWLLLYSGAPPRGPWCTSSRGLPRNEPHARAVALVVASDQAGILECGVPVGAMPAQAELSCSLTRIAPFVHAFIDRPFCTLYFLTDHSFSPAAYPPPRRCARGPSFLIIAHSHPQAARDRCPEAAPFFASLFDKQASFFQCAPLFLQLQPGSGGS